MLDLLSGFKHTTFPCNKIWCINQRLQVELACKVDWRSIRLGMACTVGCYSSGNNDRFVFKSRLHVVVQTKWGKWSHWPTKGSLESEEASHIECDHCQCHIWSLLDHRIADLHPKLPWHPLIWLSLIRYFWHLVHVELCYQPICLCPAEWAF